MRKMGKYGLILVLSGDCWYRDAQGRELDLRPGDALLVPPDLPHAYGCASGKVWGQVYVVFSGPVFDLLWGAPDFAANHPLWHLEPPELWATRLEETLRPGRASQPLESWSRILRFQQLLIEMACQDTAARRDAGDDWLESSLQILGSPGPDGWRHPREVAQRVGLSYESFRKRFASLTGYAPARFQKQRRIDLACAAIYQGIDNFKELAEQLGFCDVYHFSKAFHQHVGQPPSAYRRSVRGG